MLDNIFAVTFVALFVGAFLLPAVAGYRCMVVGKAFDVAQLLMLLRLAVTGAVVRGSFDDLGMRGAFGWRGGWLLVAFYQDRPYFLSFEENTTDRAIRLTAIVLLALLFLALVYPFKSSASFGSHVLLSLKNLAAVLLYALSLDVALAILSEYVEFDIIGYLQSFNSSAGDVVPLISFFAGGVVCVSLWTALLVLTFCYYSNDPLDHYNSMFLYGSSAACLTMRSHPDIRPSKDGLPGFIYRLATIFFKMAVCLFGPHFQQSFLFYTGCFLVYAIA